MLPYSTEMSDSMLYRRQGVFREIPKTNRELLREYESIERPISDEYFQTQGEKSAIDLTRINQFLYHGIMGDSLGKLEDIFKHGAIMCHNSREANHIASWNRYDCNGPDGISLAEYEGNRGSTFHNWICENLSLIISPSCKAVKTIFVEEQFWNWLKEQNVSLKKRYSWLPNEWQKVGDISMEHIVAIGLPQKTQSFQQPPQVEQIAEVRDRYKIKLPIVDTTGRNRIILK